MSKIYVFAGTTEGKRISRFLAENGIPVTAFVATEYGSLVLEERKNLAVHTGRMDEAEMAELFLQEDTLVIDATHPYADVVTKNLKSACHRAGAEYIRLLRPALKQEGAVTVEDAAAAARYLNGREGKALLTTGSKELSAFAQVENAGERLYARVLPTVEALEKCGEIGLRGEHIIAMQGPFSHGMNVETLRHTGARFLVTKDTGKAGGFGEKISAAREAGAEVILIARPGQEPGESCETLERRLAQRFGMEAKGENHWFPLFVNLKDQPVLVAGGGTIGLRRIQTLLSYGAAVTVADPKPSPQVKRFAEEKKLRLWERNYQSGDLAGFRLAVAATSDRETNRKIGEEAHDRNLPVSVADCRDEGSFFFPAVFEGGGVTGGVISLGGGDHAKVREQAARIRKLLAEE